MKAKNGKDIPLISEKGNPQCSAISNMYDSSGDELTVQQIGSHEGASLPVCTNNPETVLDFLKPSDTSAKFLYAKNQKLNNFGEVSTKGTKSATSCDFVNTKVCLDMGPPVYTESWTCKNMKICERRCMQCLFYQ